ncbi:MAG: hypothetical protein QGG36_18040 [Pirellulaceae bacterium]|jgi:hypothetical protein|nr:hypothetical protein [Pirellulaceae bacterium]
MPDRRQFLAGAGASLLAAPLAHAQPPQPGKRKRMAVVTTTWWYRSHAWHMAERFLVGYPLRGGWHHPEIDVVSAYVDQKPDNDLSRRRSQEFDFPIYDSVAGALRRGGEKLDVDVVLLIGEHGDYPINEFGQKQYPRYQLFKQITDVFQQDGKSTPVFNDKHLSWKFSWAKEMVELSEKLNFPFLAGSSLPVTWRMPAVEMPRDAEIEEAVGVAYGPKDIYDFHALEMMQCMLERRRGGETGVVAVQALEGNAVWQALEKPNWAAGGLDAKLLEACLSRSHTLAQPESFSHRYPTRRQMMEWVKAPVAYRIEYADGLRATMLLMNGLVQDFTFAAKLRGEAEPLSTLFYLPPTPNVVYSAALMNNAEQMFMTGRAPYPVKRTLLTSGLVEACLKSLANGQRRTPTKHLNVVYQSPVASTFWRM